MKTALITGAAGQDGSYLAEYLLELGYRVYGLVRSAPQTVQNLANVIGRARFLSADMRDKVALEAAVRKAMPDEVYNLAGQVFVPISWNQVAETFDINVGGLARLLEVLEKVKPDARVYQASSSEMYGNTDGACSEETRMRPNSPYGASKLAAHQLCAVYRQRRMFVVGGIAFNHESPRRGSEMVTRKITEIVARWVHGDDVILRLGNLEGRRDWGFAGDYVKAMHAMLQVDAPEDFVIGTGETHSVRDFLAAACNYAGIDEWDKRVAVDKRFVRPNEIRSLTADANKIDAQLNWRPQTNFQQLVEMMVSADVRQLESRTEWSIPPHLLAESKLK